MLNLMGAFTGIIYAISEYTNSASESSELFEKDPQESI